MHRGPKTRSDSHAKSPRSGLQLLAPAGRVERGSRGRAMPRGCDGAVGHGLAAGMAPGTDLSGRNWGGLEQQGLFCFLLLKCVIFWTDEEVSTLNNSGKAFFLPPGPPCVSVAAGERSRKEPTSLLVSSISASDHKGMGQHPAAGNPPKPQDPKKQPHPELCPWATHPKLPLPPSQGHLPGGDQHQHPTRWPRTEGLWQ